MEKEQEQVDTIFGEEEGDKHALAKINFDLVETGRWLLKVIAGPNNGAEFSMHAATSYVIGTDPNSCDIVFHDTSVSRQHGRITIDKNEELSIEDLKSRNGTTVDGEAVQTKKKLAPNAVVTMGTTAFTVYDREGEMQTIISPLLPAIVKVLQKEEPFKKEEVQKTAPLPLEPVEHKEELLPPEPKAEKTHHTGAFIAIGIITGLFIIAGLGTATLFKGEPVVAEQQVDMSKLLDEALKPFPAVKSYYNRATGRVQLIGHVSTQGDKKQLLYSLQGLNLNNIDDRGIIIDEYSWQDINQALAKNLAWRGISIHSPSAGKFVVSGNLQTRKQAEELSDYLSTNFTYFDKLENRLIVDEEVINTATNILQQNDLHDIAVKISSNDITLTGGIPPNKGNDLAKAVEEIKKINGIRSVKNGVKELAPEQAMVNISDKYEVTGFSRKGNSYSVVVHGRILSAGDELDGLLIKSIRANAIFLEKDGVQYRIDFGK